MSGSLAPPTVYCVQVQHVLDDLRMQMSNNWINKM